MAYRFLINKKERFAYHKYQIPWNAINVKKFDMRKVSNIEPAEYGFKRTKRR